MFGSCFATQVNVEEINQMDLEAPASKDIFQLVMSARDHRLALQLAVANATNASKGTSSRIVACRSALLAASFELERCNVEIV
jgi:hypothetical protein